jgi:SAM-dependent methyltransferase
MKEEKRERIRNALVSFAKKEFKMNATESSLEVIDQNASAIQAEQVNIVAPISPTPVSLMKEIVPQLKLDSSSRVIELGCGDGRWIMNLAKKFQCNCIGTDIDKERLKLARRHEKKIREDGERHDYSITFLSVDIFDYLGETDFVSGQDLVIMYLFREAMTRISGILKGKGLSTSPYTYIQKDGENIEERDMKSVIQLLCIGFKLPGFVPVWQSRVEGIRAYLYHAETS